MSHPYLTPAQVQTELPHYADKWGEGALPTEKWLSSRIEFNDARIDSYLGVRFAVPFDPVPAVIGELSVRYTVLDVQDRILIAQGVDPGPITGGERKRLDAWLLALQSGEAALEAAGVPQAETDASQSRRPDSTFDDSDPTFTRGMTW
jgi:hypothetical protein